MYCILIRHGQTAWNKEERFRGRTDLPLNETGLSQAQQIARSLRSEPIKAIYSSPLQRSVATAAPLASALGLAVTPLSGLNDLNLGEWQGQSPDEVAARYPDVYPRWLSAPHTVRIPGGESLDDVRERVAATLDELDARHNEDRIVLVSHQAVNKVLLPLVLGLDNSAYWRIVQDNGCLNRFVRRDGQYVVISINDTCHLKAP